MQQYVERWFPEDPEDLPGMSERAAKRLLLEVRAAARAPCARPGEGVGVGVGVGWGAGGEAASSAVAACAARCGLWAARVRVQRRASTPATGHHARCLWPPPAA
jgi:hypothetical protein